jgi:hypothetical protein
MMQQNTRHGVGAFVGFHIRVNSYVPLQVSWTGKRLSTKGTIERFLASVNSYKGPLASVKSNMGPQITYPGKGLCALGATVRFFTSVNS